MNYLLTADAQHAALDLLVEQARADAVSFARQAAAIVELNALAQREEAELSQLRQFPVVEQAGSLRLSQQAMASRASEAEHLVHHLPLTYAACSKGELFLHQAKVLLDVTKNVSAQVARRVEAALLPAAAGLCTSDLRTRAKVALMRAESELDVENGTELIADRLAEARADRRVSVRPDVDGMASLWALVPAEKAVRFSRDLDELCRQASQADKASGIERTADQRRADVLVALPGMILYEGRGVTLDGPLGLLMNITIPVMTVLDRGVEPAVLNGYGPISAEHARLLRPAAGLRGVYVDSETGQPVALDGRLTPACPDPADLRAAVDELLKPFVAVDSAEPQHDPSARLTRLVHIRDVRCSGPGCSVPAARCDRDHVTPFSRGGETAAWNLTALSARCHQAKHAGWTMVRHPDGSTTWHSPLGRTYDRPSSHEPPPRTTWQDWDQWVASGLRLVPPKPEPHQRDVDWAWCSLAEGTEASGGAIPAEPPPNPDEPAPF